MSTSETPNAGKEWTEDEDRKLVAYGCAVGYGFAARHDLGRTEQDGEQRIAWLRHHRLPFVDAIIWEMDRPPPE